MHLGKVMTNGAVQASLINLRSYLMGKKEVLTQLSCIVCFGVGVGPSASERCLEYLYMGSASLVHCKCEPERG